MNSKKVLDKAYSNVPAEVNSSNMWDWIPSTRSIKYYYLKLIRFITR